MSYKYPATSRRLQRHRAATGATQLVTLPPPTTEGQTPATPALLWAHDWEPGDAEGTETRRLEQFGQNEVESARLDAILRSIDEALLVVNSSGEIVLTNEAYTRMFGSTLTVTDATGKPLPLEGTLQKRAIVDTPFTMEFTLTEADGTRRWFEARGEPIGSLASPHGGAVTIRDISERSLHRLQTEFMAQVSHELGSPLSALILSMRMMLRRLPADVTDPITKELRSYTETALWEAERMRVLVGDLLDVSRLQKGRLRLRLQPEDLVPLVKRAVSLAQLGTRAQAFRLDVPDSPLLITGDATRLEQVVVNLLGNAIQHAPESRLIDVRLRVVDGEAEFQVQDYGPGIRSTDLPHLFSRFYGVVRPQAGLGLGLFITKQLVEAHGGRITVESEEGRGALFTVQLPLVEQAGNAYVCTIASVPGAD